MLSGNVRSDKKRSNMTWYTRDVILDVHQVLKLDTISREENLISAILYFEDTVYMRRYRDWDTVKIIVVWNNDEAQPITLLPNVIVE